MPIAVLCAGCKARFSVSDKFAGKRGPCPKCKAIIQIPALAAPEIKIAEPEQYASAGKDKKGRPVSKPIPRQETKFKPAVVGAIVLGVVVTFAVAYISRAAPAGLKWIVIALGLAMVSPPVAVGSYNVLRNDELEPYSGRSLWLRATLCSLAYGLLWAAFMFIPGDMLSEPWEWLFVGPLFVAIGAAAAWASFDIDFASGSIHYGFYLVVTLLLRATIGLAPLWSLAKS